MLVYILNRENTVRVVYLHIHCILVLVLVFIPCTTLFRENWKLYRRHKHDLCWCSQTHSLTRLLTYLVVLLVLFSLSLSLSLSPTHTDTCTQHSYFLLHTNISTVIHYILYTTGRYT